MNSTNTPPTDIDLHRLDRRFESMRIVDPSGIRRLAQSLQAYGQREPIQVVRNAEDLVLVDGYRRVQALSQMGRDTALAWIEEGCVSEAVLRVIGQHQAHRLQPIEEAWLMASLVDEGLSQQDIATSLGKDKSWVSRRLALVNALPDAFQEAVRSGELSTWVANRVLSPLARANEADALALLDALRKQPLSSRAVATWFDHYQQANASQRQRMVERPHLFLQALDDDQGRADDRRLGAGLEGQWLADVQGLERLLKRLIRTVPKVFDPAQDPPRIEVLRTAFGQADQTFERLRRQLEHHHAIPREETGHPRTPSARQGHTRDRSISEGVSQHGARGSAGNEPRTADTTVRGDPEVAARYLAATRTLLEDPGQCRAHPGTPA
jgi:ParB/RepB/Spo0J family partition protein